MRRRWTCWLAAVLLISACSHGTRTRVVRTDGTTVVGELTAARPDAVVLRLGDGSSITIPRSIIHTIESADTPIASNTTASQGGQPSNSNGGAANAGGKNGASSGNTGGSRATGNTSGTGSGGGATAARGNGTTGGNAGVGGTSGNANAGTSGGSGAPVVQNTAPVPKVMHEVVAPIGTTIELSLSTPIASDTSAANDKVDAALRAPVRINGEPLVERGAVAHGIVTEATPSAKADGRGRLAIRFDTIDVGSRTIAIQTAPIRWEAAGVTRKPAPPESHGGFFHRMVDKTKKGLRIADDAANGPHGSAEVRLAPGTPVRIRLEQSTRLAPSP